MGFLIFVLSPHPLKPVHEAIPDKLQGLWAVLSAPHFSNNGLNPNPQWKQAGWFNSVKREIMLMKSNLETVVWNTITWRG